MHENLLRSLLHLLLVPIRMLLAQAGGFDLAGTLELFK